MPSGCFTANADTSNALVMIVNPYTTPGITLSGPGVKLQGYPLIIYATVTNAGTAYSITWKNHGTTFATTTVPSVTYFKGPGTDSITAVISVTSAGCYEPDSSAVLIVRDSTTSVNSEKLTTNSVGVYPNPFNNQLTVIGLQVGDRVCVYDLLGRKRSEVWEMTNKQAEQHFSLSELPAGTYFLHVWDGLGNTRGNISLKKMK